MLRLFRPLFLLLVICSAFAMGGCLSRPAIQPMSAHPVISPGAEATSYTTPDGFHLFAQWWPVESPRAVVLLVHGTALHSGFYSPFAEHLQTEGYAVGAVDLRGWGQSDRQGKVRGYVGNYDEYVTDLRMLANDAKRRYPHSKVYLMGESLGGTVVLLAHIERAVVADGLILNAPAVWGNPGIMGWHPPHTLAAPIMWGGKALGQTFPELPLLPIYKPFVGFVLFDAEAQKRFLDDPNNTHTWLPAKYVDSLYNAMLKVRENVKNVRIPMLIMQGTKDNLIPVDSSEFLCQRSNSSDRTLAIYEGMSHATLHDYGREAVWGDITNWLEAHVKHEGNFVFNGCPREPQVLKAPSFAWLKMPSFDFHMPFSSKTPPVGSPAP